MNGAYLHLAMNHIPVVGVPLATLLLLVGTFRKSNELIKAALVGLILLALVCIGTFKTGGPAARTLFQYPGVNVERAAVHEHAEAADYAFIACNIVGAVAFVALVLLWRLGSIPMWLSLLLLLGAADASVILGRVAHLGGLIRHPEIVSNAPPAVPPAKS